MSQAWDLLEATLGLAHVKPDSAEQSRILSPLLETGCKDCARVLLGLQAEAMEEKEEAAGLTRALNEALTLASARSASATDSGGVYDGGHFCCAARKPLCRSRRRAP